MQGKAKKGFTLLELIIAIGVLAIATIPIYNMFMTSTRFNAQSHKLTIATFTAQLRMEELVGLNFEELEKAIPDPTDKKPFNGFLVQAVYDEYDGGTYDSLYEITITVYEDDGTTVIYTEKNIINVDGIATPTGTTT
jgi:prepilin-type N-terminal cleavage/methylation domain-containing protein